MFSLFKNCETRTRVENPRTNTEDQGAESGWNEEGRINSEKEKRKEEREENRRRGRGEEKQAVRREVAAGSTNSVLSRWTSSGHRESHLLPLLHGALRPSPALAARRQGRGCGGRTKLAAISSRFRARSGTTVAPLRGSWWGTPPRVPPGPSSVQRWGPEGALLLFLLLLLPRCMIPRLRPRANRNGSYKCVCMYVCM